ncbi:hypothetical protein OEZ85_003273 [Tetradesmus obliquus]|uniref:Uncharacterized protein n=1 Tax=Tetradesmus obliquus TaxID=3088 RepID=A0ABY8U086_TETOB|nr:hypothetical protein OEZ85_003273 [Tetradesmus obliquus]
MMGTAQLNLQIDNRLSVNSRDRVFSWRPPADQLLTLLLPLNSGQALEELQCNMDVRNCAPAAVELITGASPPPGWSQ